MRVLLVGNGGREDAIAWKLSKSKELTKLYIGPGNPGTARWGENVALKPEDVGEVVKFAKENKVELVIVGPEDPLAEGLVDALEAEKIKAFGPNKAAAQLEADKSFSKQIINADKVIKSLL